MPLSRCPPANDHSNRSPAASRTACVQSTLPGRAIPVTLLATLTAWPGLPLGAAEDPAPDAVAKVRVERRDEHGRHRRRELPRERLEPQRHVLLAVARLQERVDECCRRRRRDPRHRLAEHARDLGDRLVAKSRLAEQPHRLGGGEVHRAHRRAKPGSRAL